MGLGWPPMAGTSRLVAIHVAVLAAHIQLVNMTAPFQTLRGDGAMGRRAGLGGGVGTDNGAGPGRGVGTTGPVRSPARHSRRSISPRINVRTLILYVALSPGEDRGTGLCRGPRFGRLLRGVARPGGPGVPPASGGERPPTPPSRRPQTPASPAWVASARRQSEAGEPPVRAVRPVAGGRLTRPALRVVRRAPAREVIVRPRARQGSVVPVHFFRTGASPRIRR
jgi:hypothetical protein